LQTYNILFDYWIYNPGWAKESYWDCILSDDGSTLCGLITATTWTGTKDFIISRVYNTDTSSNNHDR